MRILGVFGGIGSPMVGAVRAGHEIVGNIEPRSLAHKYDEEGRNTFLENFPGAWLVKSVDDIPPSELENIDIIAGHPKCGRYSNLINKTGAEREEYASKQSDEFLEFIRITNMVKPKFAFFDNLPKSLDANPPQLYRDLLPDYDITVEYVSNYFYGNSQTNRNRLFIIASLKELEYEFTPGEEPNDDTIMDAIADISDGTFNHDKHSLKAKSNSGRRIYQDDCMTWAQVKKTFDEKDDNHCLHYLASDNTIKYHFGFRRANAEKGCPTLIGTHPILHPETSIPLSIRERARVMGFPDDFNFYGTNYEEDGTWVHNRNNSMIQQTGRCIPCEFPKFLIDQFEAFIYNKTNYYCSCQRLAKPNKYVENHLSEE